MNRSTPKLLSLLAMLAVWTLVGCAHKSAPAPTPTPTPTPTATTPTPAPAPAPAPAPTPPAPAPATIAADDLKPVFFDLDSSTLTADARGILDGNAKVLRDHPTVHVTLEGHCDERGTIEYNQALGERRAQAAHDYLVAAGIAASRLDVISYGKEKPFNPGHDETAWAANRRAHFTIRP